MKKALLLAACGLMIGSAAFAQEDKLVIKPSGRILLDGAAMNSSNDVVNDEMSGGFNIPDVRIGMKATYGKWEAKADVGYARNSLSLKDVYIQYNIDKNNLIRGGYFVHQFGYQSATSSSFKVAMEEPETHSLLGSGGRLVGLMFQHDDDAFHGTFSVYTDNQSMKRSTENKGYQGTGVMTRLVWRPLTERGNIFQIGVGGAYDHKNKKSDNLEWSSNLPTRVSRVAALGASGKALGADYSIKFTPEVVFAKKWFGFEGQYIFMTAHRNAKDVYNYQLEQLQNSDEYKSLSSNAEKAVMVSKLDEVKNRKNSDYKNYKAWGAYANIRFLLNNEYDYVRGDAGLATPDPKSWEIVASYNYSDMNSGSCKDADYWNYYNGGKLSDYSLTMNYYINKYMIWRVSGHYVHAGESEYTHFGKNDFKVLETRLQIKF